jgi:DNA-binding MarR family transcriptional regulator
LGRIKESHALLQQFSPKELKILMNLKRNTSPKAWTLREDLVVLSLSLSNREIADILNDRNKEAVKKRLQLLRSKGLIKREPGITTP